MAVLHARGELASGERVAAGEHHGQPVHRLARRERRGRRARAAHPRPRLRHRRTPRSASTRATRSAWGSPPGERMPGVASTRSSSAPASSAPRAPPRSPRDGLRVLVLDARFAGGGTTAAAMGHLVVMDDSPAQLALTASRARLWTELAAALPRRARTAVRHASGSPRTTRSWRRVRRQAARLRAARRRAEVLDAAGPRRAPSRTCAAGSPAGCVVPGDARALPAAAARCPARAGARRAAPSCASGARGGVGRRPRRASGRAAARCTPAWSSTPPAPPRRARRPGSRSCRARGTSSITDRHPGFCRHQIVELGYLDERARDDHAESVAFNLQPRATGQLLLGSSRELVGLGRGRSTGAILRPDARARAPTSCRALAGALGAPRTWTGLPPRHARQAAARRALGPEPPGPVDRRRPRGARHHHRARHRAACSPTRSSGAAGDRPGAVPAGARPSPEPPMPEPTPPAGTVEIVVDGRARPGGGRHHRRRRAAEPGRRAHAALSATRRAARPALRHGRSATSAASRSTACRTAAPASSPAGRGCGSPRERPERQAAAESRLDEDGRRAGPRRPFRQLSLRSRWKSTLSTRQRPTARDTSGPPRVTWGCLWEIEPAWLSPGISAFPP